jgi:hypothetical protein
MKQMIITTNNNIFLHTLSLDVVVAAGVLSPSPFPCAPLEHKNLFFFSRFRLFFLLAYQSSV